MSAVVSGLPSVSAARIAVTGRQRLYSYLASQVEMMASAIAMFSRANRRASPTRSRSSSADTTSWAMMFQWPKA